MWTSLNQKIGYMVVTSHWIDSEWRLNMRVLNFCNVPPPHSGYVIADALSRCLNEVGIDDKIGTIVVDNAKNNDAALRSLKDIFTIRNPLPVGGKLFHARCCAHILNLCVQDGLKPIEFIVDRIRDGVKYVAASEGRRIKFAEISQQLHLKTKKLILDVSTRWNSTFNMLQCASEFKQVFSRYGASDLGFRCYVPDEEDWEKVNWVCSILGAFNEVTKIVSGTHYPTSNLFLSELKLVKHILDKKAFDPNLHIREMTEAMKEKFDKYWGESNLVMSIGAVLDPRFKMKLPTFCFPTLYPKEGESERNLTYLSNVLNDLYHEYVKEDKAGKKKEIGESSDVTSADNEFNQNSSEVPQGLNDYEIFIHASGAIQEPLKSELDDYLDILSIPMSTVASESTFSAGSRVIEPHCSCIKPETVEMLLCGADWARELYGLKRTMQGNQDMLEDIEIDLSI
nr:PREDICTED: zinc finger BED domain-containing protein RICESLEEPER 2-like [Daucus carota subsp. sativus]